MKTGIITCHDVFNYGSSLQAYALSQQLKELGTAVSIIDYKPDYMYRLMNFMEVDSPKWRTSLWRRWVYRLRLFPVHLAQLPKYRRYRKFNRTYLPLTSKHYKTESSLSALEGYDAFVCGSDQIWASIKNKCGEDGAFFLSFGKNARKIAYAASFGASEISEAGEQCVTKYLPSFDAIGVRESSGVSLLQRYGISAQQVVDPVFLMEKAVWERMAKAPKELPENYILTYGYDSSMDLNTLAAEQGHLPLVSLQEKAYGCYGPEEFLYMIKNARLVVTSSFHAIAFCLIFETPFIAVQTGNVQLFERLSSVLELTGLSGRIWQAGKAYSSQVDFTGARAALAKTRGESLRFLKEALYGTKDI